MHGLANLLTWIPLEIYRGFWNCTSIRGVLVTLGNWRRFAKRNGPNLNLNAAEKWITSIYKNLKAWTANSNFARKKCVSRSLSFLNIYFFMNIYEYVHTNIHTVHTYILIINKETKKTLKRHWELEQYQISIKSFFTVNMEPLNIL